MPVALFFQLFPGLTSYEGKDPETGHHVLKLEEIEGITTDKTPKLFFYYTDTKPAEIHSIGIKTDNTATYKLRVTEGPKLNDELDDSLFDVPKACSKMSKDALDEGISYASFVKTLMSTFVDKEDEILAYLEKKYSKESLDVEDDADGEESEGAKEAQKSNEHTKEEL
jgi:hypothetical protein